MRALLSALAVLAVVLSLALIPGAAQANVASVRCVQEQLNAAGYQAGAVDGVVGPQTRSAWTRFAEDRGLSTAMALHSVTAPNHCRRIGLAEPALQAHWPSRTTPFIFAFDESVNPLVRLQVEQVARNLHAEVVDLLGIVAAGTDHLVVATSAPALSRLVRARIDYVIRDLDEGIRRDCAGPEAIGGAASHGLIRLCLPGIDGGTAKAPHGDLAFVLAHEITHALELQLEGEALRRDARGRSRRDHPPIWLIEGLADLVAARLIDGLSIAEIADATRADLAGTLIPPLRVLDGPDAVRDHRLAIYRLGTVAVADLAGRHGLQAFGRLFDQLGRSVPFEDAFVAIFEEDLHRFEARIDAGLRPLSAGAVNPGQGARPFPDPTPAQRAALQCVQRELVRLGQDPGPIDGQPGPRTQDALDAVRAQRGLGGAGLTPLSAQRWCEQLRAQQTPG